MCVDTDFARFVIKRGNGEPTIPTSLSHNDGWLATDIYEGELYLDLDTGKTYIRIDNDIVEVPNSLNPGDNIYTADGTLTGDREVNLDGNKLTFKDEVDPTDYFRLDFERDSLYNMIRLSARRGDFISYQRLMEASSSISSANVSTNRSSSVSVSPNSAILESSDSSGLGSNTQNITVEKDRIVFGTHMGIPYIIFHSNSEPSSVVDFRSTDRGVLLPRLTETQMLAISSPANYLEVVNTTRGIKMIYDPFFGWMPVGPIPPYWGWEHHDECTGENGTIFEYIAANVVPYFVGAAISGDGVSPDARHCTVVPYIHGGSLTKFESNCWMSSPNEQSLLIGSVDSSFDWTSMPDGAYFLLDKIGTIYQSDYVQIVCSVGGVATRQDTTILVDDLTLNTHFEVLTNDDTKVAKFIINGNEVGTINTNYPDAVFALWGEFAHDMLSKSITIWYSHIKQKVIIPR